jgi:pimeloyl-ACP methyl ester carboxylesterase
MATIYCIPGTGVDERVFSRLDLEGHDVHYVHWIVPYKKETLEDYALRLSAQIKPVRPLVLIGVSFGGMLCTVLAKHLKPDRVFIISSSKSRKELPHRIRWLRLLPFHRLLPDSSYVKAASLSRRIFGFVDDEDGELFLEMLRTAPKGFYPLAVDCIVRWKPKEEVSGIIHIHGTKDKLLPIRRVKPDYVIEGGTHNMVVTHSKQVSEIINKELKGL